MLRAHQLQKETDMGRNNAWDRGIKYTMTLMDDKSLLDFANSLYQQSLLRVVESEPDYNFADVLNVMRDILRQRFSEHGYMHSNPGAAELRRYGAKEYLDSFKD